LWIDPYADDGPFVQLSTWFDPVAIHMVNFSHTKNKAQDLLAAMFDSIIHDSTLSNVSDAVEEVCDLIQILELCSD
jgi:hypothetical protein